MEVYIKQFVILIFITFCFKIDKIIFLERLSVEGIMDKTTKQEILDNRFVQEIMSCAHTKFGSDTYRGKFRISCFRRLLCAALYPVHKELGEMEAFYQSLSPDKSPTASSFLYLELGFTI